jgi:hypothetical protein
MVSLLVSGMNAEFEMIKEAPVTVSVLFIPIYSELIIQDS